MDRRKFLQNTSAALLTTVTANAAISKIRTGMLGTGHSHFGGKLKAMPPKLLSDDGAHIVIRPLAYVQEEDLTSYAERQRFPIIPCDLCGSQPTLQRKQIKALMRDWERLYPGRVESIFRSLQDVRPSHLLDTELFNFNEITRAVDGVED